jgi:hypothetical protein
LYARSAIARRATAKPALLKVDYITLRAKLTGVKEVDA